jgi:hypothetical protein
MSAAHLVMPRITRSRHCNRLCSMVAANSNVLSEFPFWDTSVQIAYSSRKSKDVRDRLFSLPRHWWWYEAQPSILARRSTTILIVGIILAFIALAYFCWLLFALTVYELPFFGLCGRPHKANYVACHDMWRTGRLMLILLRTIGSARHISARLQRA